MMSRQISNKKAFHHYNILETLEAGLVLMGSEVKSIRQGHLSLAESYIAIKKEEAWLIQCHILPYAQANRLQPNPIRDRKLLLHQAQIKKLAGQVEKKRLTIVPLKIYLKKGRFKCEIGLGRSKKLFDKRKVLKDKAVNRDIQREIKNNRY